MLQAASFLSAAALGVTYLYLRNARRRGDGAAALTFTAVQAPYIASESSPAVRHYTVSHLSTTFPSTATFPSPLCMREWPRNNNFVGLHDEVVESQLVSRSGTARRGEEVRAFVRAGPVESLYWDPRVARAAIVTCGGLCPGLNTVVREIVMCLHYVYGTREVYGVMNGYMGIYNGTPWQALTPQSVSHIHTLGGTVLGSSRGGFDLDKILGALQEKGINMLFLLGGDGTHRGALELIKGAAARGLRISVIGVPKTIDNDIPLCVTGVCRSGRAKRSQPLPPKSRRTLFRAPARTHTHTHPQH
jgi:6-phosphofructokinase 1